MENLLNTESCTMPSAERPLRVAEFEDLFSAALYRVEHRGADVRLHLTGTAGLTEQVRDLTERETQCCSFFTFEIRGTDDGLTLDISVPPAQQAILDALAERASELSA